MDKRKMTVLAAGFIGLMMVAGPAASAKVTLRLLTWDTGTGLTTIKEAVNLFTKSNPNIEVKVESTGGWDGYSQKLMTQMAAGQTPDVFMIGDVDVGYFASSGFVQSLTPFVNQDKFDLSDMKKGLLKQFVYTDGKLYGLPKDDCPVIVFYNKTLFSQVGLPNPKQDWTWDEALEMGKKLTKTDPTGKIIQNGLQANTSLGTLHQLLKVFGTSVIGKDNKYSGYLDSSATAQAMGLLCDIRNKYKTMSNFSDFGSGKTAMSVDGPWQMSVYRTKKGLSYGAMTPPSKVTSGSAYYCASWSVSTNTKRKKEAWELVKFLGGPKGHRVMAENEWGLPGWRSVVKAMKLDSNPDLGPVMDASEDAVSISPVQYPFYSPVFNKYIQPIIDKAFTGKVDVALALKQVAPQCQKEYDRLLSRSKGRGNK